LGSMSACDCTNGDSVGMKGLPKRTVTLIYVSHE